MAPAFASRNLPRALWSFKNETSQSINGSTNTIAQSSVPNRGSKDHTVSSSALANVDGQRITPPCTTTFSMAANDDDINVVIQGKQLCEQESTVKGTLVVGTFENGNPTNVASPLHEKLDDHLLIIALQREM
ncbi:hypothetical protein JHK86_039865 [Glycine max]|nr:hypothetical protein JHK86_039865 [Glycine max]